MATKSASARRPALKRRVATQRAPLPALKRFTERWKLDAVMDAIKSVQLTKTPAWKDLRNLSTDTQIDGVEAVPEGIFESGSNEFTAIATVYVHLDGKHGVSDSFPAEMKGRFGPDEKAIVDTDTVSVDTSAFFE